MRRKHLFQRRFVCLRIQNTNMSTTTILAWNYCYALEGICLFVCSLLVFTCVLCRLCLVLACHHRKVHKQDSAAGQWHPFFTVVVDLLIHFQDKITFAFSLSRFKISIKKKGRMIVSVLIFFAATPQFANNGHRHCHCHHHSHRHHHRHHHRHPHYELLAMAGCMRKTMVPKVSDCMGKLMPWVNPWMLSWENPCY